MLFPTSQLVRVHSLGSCQLELGISGRKLKPVTNQRLLGIEIDQYLQWNDHGKATLSTCFSTLHTLKKT